MLLWELATRTQPFSGLDVHQVFHAVVHDAARPPVPAAVPATFRHLISDCWQDDPQARPSLAAVVAQLRVFLDLESGCGSSSGSDCGSEASMSL
jgi:hypothetical protein